MVESADLMFNQAEAECNSFVKLFNINGRVSIFALLEQNTGDGNGNGMLNFGVAVPASLKVSLNCTRCVRHTLTLHFYRNPTNLASW